LIPPGFSVTLVQPNYPVNVGHVARLVKNFGVRRLYLIDPKFDMSVATVYAAHASDVLSEAKVVSFEQLRKRNQLLVATTAVKATRSTNVIRRSVAPERVSRYIRSTKTSSLVLGRDTTGLTNEEIRLCDITTTIETGSNYRTLNVSHAAAIMLYLITKGDHMRSRTIQSRKIRDVFAESFYQLASVSGLPKHKVKNMREIGRQLAIKSELADRELALMAGVFRRAARSISVQSASYT
jgi:tRNA/rRNA methyltransferase